MMIPLIVVRPLLLIFRRFPELLMLPLSTSVPALVVQFCAFAKTRELLIVWTLPALLLTIPADAVSV